MKSAVGFFASKIGRSCVIACSAQYSGDPFAVTRRSKCSGGTNIRLVSSNAPVWMRSTQITKVLPPLAKASRVAGVGQMKSAIAKQPDLHHLIAQPSHAAGVLDAVGLGKSEVRD